MNRIDFFSIENFKLKSIRCRLGRNDPRIRNIATDSNYLVNKSFLTWAQATADTLFSSQWMLK